MPVLPILTVPDPVLKMVAVDVSKFDDRLKRLVSDMFDTVKPAMGVGLAAPQVGILERLFIVDFDGFKEPFINPEIIEKRGSVSGVEGCLSIPGVELKVDRAEWIKVRTHTLDGSEVEMEVDGFVARIVQHELDHLNGVLISDRSQTPA